MRGLCASVSGLALRAFCRFSPYRLSPTTWRVDGDFAMTTKGWEWTWVIASR